MPLPLQSRSSLKFPSLLNSPKYLPALPRVAAVCAAVMSETVIGAAGLIAALVTRRYGRRLTMVVGAGMHAAVQLC